MAEQKCKLGVVNFGIALGLTWSLGIFLLGLMSWLGDWGTPMVTLMASLYLGYTGTFIGSVIGAIWAFIDWFIGGVVIAWIYNSLTTHSID